MWRTRFARAARVVGILFGCSLTAEAAMAQEKPLGAFPPLPSEPSAVADAYGLGPQDHFVAATDFNASYLESNHQLVWDSTADFFPYFKTGEVNAFGDGILFAHLRLPSGARLTSMQCFFRNTNVLLVPRVVVLKAWHDLSTNTPGFAVLSDLFVPLGVGYFQPSIPLSDTIRSAEGTRRNIYLLQVTLPHPAIDAWTSFAGCNFTWNRQVTPAPGSATFADVPVGHQQFRFVEALFAAGITAGCGPGIYCPDAPITRGQMAVFLAAALGLHFPN